MNRTSQILDQLEGLKPSACAPYGNPREYITSWTDKIWISRGLGHLRDHYAPGVKVHTACGETYGYDDVMRDSIQRMVAFPNRVGGHDDVIWACSGHGFKHSAGIGEAVAADICGEHPAKLLAPFRLGRFGVDG